MKMEAEKRRRVLPSDLLLSLEDSHCSFGQA